VYIMRENHKQGGGLGEECTSVEGSVFGTFYHITYGSKVGLNIDSVLAEVDKSLSPFNKRSVITAINRNTSMRTDERFREVFRLSMEVSEETNGAFDITVAPLVNAWGFGFDKAQEISEERIDSLLQFVGYRKVRLEGDTICKDDSRLMLDCSAVAKGYGVDVVAQFLRSQGIKDYMVEIGGEVAVRGKNPKGEDWHIGIDRPDDDSLNTSNKLQDVLIISNKAMATSGNYRNFYVKDHKKYAHTIDPRTGHPIQHNILSATVVAPTCAEADAYATSFMVMGMDGARAVLKKHAELSAYLIYTDEKGRHRVWHSDNLKLASE